MASPHYDICVVGAGTLGTPAARHIKLISPTTNLLLIGPSEQTVKQEHYHGGVHGAHYDEGRITTELMDDPVLDALSRRSIDRYRQIELQSGIWFYEEVGYICVRTNTGEPPSMDVTHGKHLTKEEISKMMPYFHPRSNDVGNYAKTRAGHISPREMVRAHRKLAHQSGCDIVDDIVKTIIPPSGDEDSYRLETDTGRVFYSRKVLLATGAFTNCRNLLPDGVVPDIDTHSESVILIEIDESRLAWFNQMPSIVVEGADQGPSPPGVPTSPRVTVAYILPPIRYPDGKTYIKIGHGKIGMVLIKTPQDIQKWYNRRDVGPKEEFVYQLVKTFLPDLPMQKYKYEHCVTAHTPHGFPFIDMLTPSLGVLLAGNGQSAASADELDRIAARMIVKGAWDSDLPKERFRFINKHPPSKL